MLTGDYHKVHSEAGLSPGVHSLRYADKCLKHRKRVQERSALPSTKRRRLQLKQERSITQGAQEALEDMSYQSEIGHSDDADIQKLPDLVPRGDFKPIVLPTGQPTYIAFDLETTGLIQDGQIPHITQVAATEPKSGKAFNMYVLPTLPISDKAQEVTGLRMVDHKMQYNGTNVEAYSIYEALKSYCDWLEKFQNVVLVAHNGRRFDFPVLLTACDNVGLRDRMCKCVAGCADSLSIFRKAYPNRKSYKQEDLAKDLLGASYCAHNASEDVLILGKLIHHLDILSVDMLPHTFSAKSVYNSQLCSRKKLITQPDYGKTLINLLSHVNEFLGKVVYEDYM